MLFEIPTRGTMMCMAERLSWMNTEVLRQAHITNQCWSSSVLIVSLSDCQLSLSNETMLSLHVLPKLKIWKLITSVQVDHSCRNSPCFNLCVSYLFNVIMLLPVLMIIYAYGILAETNILLTLTLTLTLIYLRSFLRKLGNISCHELWSNFKLNKRILNKHNQDI